MAPNPARDGAGTEFDAVHAPLEWGRSVCTVVVLPLAPVRQARE